MRAGTTARTVTFQGTDAAPGHTYVIADGATIRVGDAAGTFASITAGSRDSPPRSCSATTVTSTAAAA